MTRLDVKSLRIAHGQTHLKSPGVSIAGKYSIQNQQIKPIAILPLLNVLIKIISSFSANVVIVFVNYEDQNRVEINACRSKQTQTRGDGDFSWHAFILIWCPRMPTSPIAVEKSLIRCTMLMRTRES